VPLAARFSPEVVAIYETAAWLESKGVKNTRAMNKGGSQKVGEVTVTMTHAVHSCGILDEGKIVYGGEAAGYVLRFADNRALYFAGDTNVFSDMALIEQLYHPELAFLPIGDLFTMGPREAALACRLLRPKKVIPMHFGTFPPLTGRPDDLRERITRPGNRSGRSNPASRWSGSQGAIMAAKRIGILTGGGDVPGLNSVIKTVVYRGSEIGCEVIGIRRGWEGLTHVNLQDPASRTRYVLPLNRENTRTIDRTGGTYLHSSRTNPSKMKKLPPVLEGQEFPVKSSPRRASPPRSST
jgi:hypothetical protein